MKLIGLPNYNTQPITLYNAADVGNERGCGFNQVLPPNKSMYANCYRTLLMEVAWGTIVLAIEVILANPKSINFKR
jgi:hypothetical protein